MHPCKTHERKNGFQDLFFRTWFSILGFQDLSFQTCLSRRGFQDFVFKTWFSKLGFQDLSSKPWFLILGQPVAWCGAGGQKYVAPVLGGQHNHWSGRGQGKHFHTISTKFQPFPSICFGSIWETLAHSECQIHNIYFSECSPISQCQQCNMSWNVLQAHFLLFSSSPLPAIELPPPPPPALELSLLASRLCNSPREPVSEGRRREGATFFS